MMSGWSPRASPTCFAWSAVGATRSTQTAASGLARSSGRPASAAGALDLVDARRLRRRRSGWSRAGRPVPWPPGGGRGPGGRRRARGQSARPGSGGSRPSTAGPSSCCGVGVVQHTRTLASSSAEGQAGRDGHRGHPGRDDEQPDHDRGGLARRPRLERADDERVAQRPIAERLRDELAIGVRRRVHLVVQAVDGRRAVGGQDREPDRHPEHPGDGHDRRRRPERATPGRLHGRGRARGDGQPEPEPERAEPERDGLEARLRRPARHREEAADAQRQPAERDEPERDDPDDEARGERPDRGRAGQRPEREALLVRTAVQDPVDEHRATDDRGRERVARQQGHERGRRERHAPEEARVEERVLGAQARGRPRPPSPARPPRGGRA